MKTSLIGITPVLLLLLLQLLFPEPWPEEIPTIVHIMPGPGD